MRKLHIISLLVTIGAIGAVRAQNNPDTTLRHAMKVQSGYTQLDFDASTYEGLHLSAAYERHLKNYLSAELDLTFDIGKQSSIGNDVPDNPFRAGTFSAGINGKLKVFKRHTLSFGPFTGLALLGAGFTILSKDGQKSTNISYNLNFVYGVRAYYSIPVGKTTQLGLSYTLQLEVRNFSNQQIQRLGLVFIKNF